ncbi:MAG: hypothetical protein J0L75_13440 [Spirochaetes bacterium]|nr:hypothetical protein [Spirochaetota bacterium]
MAFLRSLLHRLGLAEALSDDERRRRLAAIEAGWREITGGASAYARLIDQFHKRYDAACRTGRELAFLDEEHAALDEQFRALHEKDRLARAAAAQAAAPAGPGVIQGIFKEFEDRLKRHPRLPIGEGAEAEIEHLYGCLVQFEKRWVALLRAAAVAMGERALQRDLGEFEGAFRPLTQASSRLPSTFERYRARVASMRSRDDIQKEGQSPLREAYLLLRRVRQAAQGLRDDPRAPGAKLTLPNGNVVSAEAAAIAALDEIKQIFHDFRLKGLE